MSIPTDLVELMAEQSRRRARRDWEAWPPEALATIDEMLALRREGVLVSAETTAALLHRRHGVLTSYATLDRYARIVLGRYTFAKEARDRS